MLAVRKHFLQGNTKYRAYTKQSSNTRTINTGCTIRASVNTIMMGEWSRKEKESPWLDRDPKHPIFQAKLRS